MWYMPQPRITVETMLHAYASGVFPMAESRDSDRIAWCEPRIRGILPIGGFRISRSLGRSIGRNDYTVAVDTDFRGTVEACADRPETWINGTILTLYLDLHAAGLAHSLEVRDLSGALVGGVFGVALGAAFFAESMFSRRTDASKVALAWLMHRLRAGGFRLVDTQYPTPHLASLGGVSVRRGDYRAMLEAALAAQARFDPPGYAPDRQSVRQRSTQTS